MDYRMLALAACAAIAPQTAFSDEAAKMRQACFDFRSVEDQIDPARSHNDEFTRRIRRDFRSSVEVSVTEYPNIDPLRFDCTIKFEFKYDPVIAARDGQIAQFAENFAATAVFLQYKNSLQTAMKRYCDTTGYEVQDVGEGGSIYSTGPDRNRTIEVFYHTKTCTKAPWNAYFP